MLGIGARRGGRLDEVVDPQALAARVLEDGEALTAGVLPGGGYAQVGDGFHGTVDGIMFPDLNLTLWEHETRPVPRSMMDQVKRPFFLDKEP